MILPNGEKKLKNNNIIEEKLVSSIPIDKESENEYINEESFFSKSNAGSESSNEDYHINSQFYSENSQELDRHENLSNNNWNNSNIKKINILNNINNLNANNFLQNNSNETANYEKNNIFRKIINNNITNINSNIFSLTHNNNITLNNLFSNKNLQKNTPKKSINQKKLSKVSNFSFFLKKSSYDKPNNSPVKEKSTLSCALPISSENNVSINEPHMSQKFRNSYYISFFKSSFVKWFIHRINYQYHIISSKQRKFLKPDSKKFSADCSFQKNKNFLKMTMQDILCLPGSKKEKQNRELIEKLDNDPEKYKEVKLILEDTFEQELKLFYDSKNFISFKELPITIKFERCFQESTKMSFLKKFGFIEYFIKGKKNKDSNLLKFYTEIVDENNKSYKNNEINSKINSFENTSKDGKNICNKND